MYKVNMYYTSKYCTDDLVDQALVKDIHQALKLANIMRHEARLNLSDYRINGESYKILIADSVGAIVGRKTIAFSEDKLAES